MLYYSNIDYLSLVLKQWNAGKCAVTAIFKTKATGEFNPGNESPKTKKDQFINRIRSISRLLVYYEPNRECIKSWSITVYTIYESLIYRLSCMLANVKSIVPLESVLLIARASERASDRSIDRPCIPNI